MRRVRALILTILFVAIAALPAFAQTTDILSPLTRLVQAIQSTLTGPLGVAWPSSPWPGRPSASRWAARWVVYVAVGAALLFGASTIISFISGQ